MIDRSSPTVPARPGENPAGFLGREPRRGLVRLTPMNATSRPDIRRGLTVLIATTFALALAGCGGTGSTSAADPDRPPAPAAVPAASGTVTGLGMVMDSGKGTTICLGPIGESYPPSCEGTPLAGWDWKAVEGFEHVYGVKFGMFAVTGTWDGTTLTLTEPAVSAALYDPAPDPNYMRSVATRCEPPADGWAVADPATANANALERAQSVAAEQDGFVAAWSDQYAEVTIPPYDEDPDPDMGDDGAIGPLPVVLNVLVTGDVDAAKAAITEVWGGALCVTEPDNDPATLEKAATELSDLEVVESASVMNDRVVVSTLFDDGTLQDYADEAYGADAVVVTPALRTVS